MAIFETSNSKKIINNKDHDPSSFKKKSPDEKLFSFLQGLLISVSVRGRALTLSLSRDTTNLIVGPNCQLTSVKSRQWQCQCLFERVFQRVCSLTRFNKICHPSQRPRWQVDKEAIGLSRVQQCSSTYNPPS